MKTATLSALTSLVCLLAPSGAQAWWADGHELIAAVAYQELTSAEQSKVDSILGHHPLFATWSSGGASHLEIFMKASTWADDIRNYSDPTTHPNWHFIDYPLSPPSYAMKPPLTPTDDAVAGIDQLKNLLDDPHNPPTEQAKNLAFLIHFVGDIHQPLHCESLFNTTYKKYADGDRGGNRFIVHTNTTSTTNTKLHSLWDALLGDGEALTDIEARVAALKTAHPRTGFTAQLAKTDPNDWSLESRTLAINSGYKPLPALNGTATHAVTLPANYISQARSLSEQQAALAGYRLADTIKAILIANP